MFRPNNFCLLSRATSSAPDIYGNRTYAIGAKTACAVVTYDLATHKTSVRTDSSASKGRAEDLEGVVRFLFPTFVTIARGDRVFKDGYSLEVIEVHQRYTVFGKLDHFEVDLRPFVETV